MSEDAVVAATDDWTVRGAVQAMRDGHPLVQCITNNVVTNFTANALLAAGAAPAMVDNSYEAGHFAKVASAVLVNTGTPQDDTVGAMHEAVRACSESGTPWVLDPVAAGGLGWRTCVARELLNYCPPRIVRGNASEILGLTGGSGGRGVDTADPAEDALQAGVAMARKLGTVVAISGPVDHITDGTRTITVANGNPLMTRVTGVGCCLGALMAAFAATVDDPLIAAVSATAMLTVAADAAHLSGAHAPGGFAAALLDQLYLLSPDDIAEDVKLGHL